MAIVDIDNEVDEVLYLMSFRLQATVEDPELYTLYLCHHLSDKQDTIVMDDAGRPLFCRHRDSVPLLLKEASPEFGRELVVPTELHGTYDLPSIVHVIIEGRDCWMEFTDLLILVADFLSATKLDVSEKDHRLIADLFCYIIESGGDIHDFGKKHSYSFWEIVQVLSDTASFLVLNSRIVDAVDA